jgi:hypothetical protein
MGTKSIGLADALFSKVQQRVPGLVFVNPDRSFYTNEIVSFVGSGEKRYRCADCWKGADVC